jgi:hypothetical protein
MPDLNELQPVQMSDGESRFSGTLQNLSFPDWRSDDAIRLLALQETEKFVPVS